MKKVCYWFRKLKKRLEDNGIKITFRYYLSVLLKTSRLEIFIIKIFKIFPTRNVLIFECENDMQDNARALYEYLYDQNYSRKYKMIWIVKDLEYCKKKFSKKNVYFFSKNIGDAIEKIKFSYYISCAKYFFFTHPWWLKEWKKKQTVVHLCHGAPPLKGRDQTKKNDIGKTFDYILAPSIHVIPWECDFWGCTEDKAIVLGAPRNDWLFRGIYKNSLKPFFQKKEDEKVILAMPTFRQTENWIDSEKIDRFCLNVIDTVEQMEELNILLVSLKIHVLIKIHPLQKLEVIEKRNYSNIHYLSNQEMYEKDVSVDEIMGCCDALITDFSSVYMEYLLLDRPVAFFIDPNGEYKRGYIMSDPENYMPGEKISDFNMLKEFICHIAKSQDEYAEDRRRVKDLINTYQDANNCKRLVDFLKL